MIIGIPKEVKTHEYRVGMTPVGVEQIVREGNVVLVEGGAGKGAGFSNQEYKTAGAKIFSGAREIWEKADLIVKVKEPQPGEFKFLRPGLTLFTFLHLAANPAVQRELLKKKVTALAYETLETKDGRRPLLEPMSRIAGYWAALLGAHFLRRDAGGKGIVLSSLHGSPCGQVTVLGAGHVGEEAVRVAHGLGAEVTVLDCNLQKLNHLQSKYPARLHVLSDAKDLPEVVRKTDLLIGAILVSGQRTPILVTRDMVRLMGKGSVIVDVAVDQGGCVATIRPTTLKTPTYVVGGVIHCGVTNLPSLAARSATLALSTETLPYILKMTRCGVGQALQEDSSLKKSLQTRQGEVVPSPN